MNVKDLYIERRYRLGHYPNGLCLVVDETVSHLNLFEAIRPLLYSRVYKKHKELKHENTTIGREPESIIYYTDCPTLN